MTPQDLLAALARGTLEGGGLLLLLWAVTRLWPRMPAGARRALWWLGSLRMILALIPLPALRLDWTPPAPLPASVAAPAAALGSLALPVIEALPASNGVSVDAIVAAGIALWLLGVGVGALLMARRLGGLRRAWRSARPFDDARALAWRAEWCDSRQTRPPDLRVSPDVDGPLVVGALRPGILLPAGSEALPDQSLRLVLAHEFSHLRRHDTLFGWIPAAAQLLFWFHPLVRLATREFLLAREELCDADALRLTGAAPADYGRLLIDFGVGRASGLPGAAACGSPEGRHLKRRLEMLSTALSVPTAHRVGAVALVTLFLLVGFAPVRWVGANEGLDRKSGGGPKRHVAPVAYLLWSRGETGSRGSIDELDLENARDLVGPHDADLLYFRFGNRAWITRDAATIAEVRRALEPEDRYEEQRQPAELRRKAMDDDHRRLMERNQAIDERERVLQEKAEALDRARAELIEAGRSTRELRTERERLQAETAALEQDRRALWNRIQDLDDELQALYRGDKAAYAERDRIHDRCLQDIGRIGRRAIQEGKAEEYRR